MGKADIVLEDLPEGKKLVRIRPVSPKYRALLSIDGGGVRGIIPAILLRGFEEAVKEVVQEVSSEAKAVDVEDLVVDIRDCFDAVAGNSAGSILALYLASGGGREELYGSEGHLMGIRPGSAQGAIALVSAMVKEIFATPFYRKIPGLRGMAGLLFAKYGCKGLAGVMDKIFGDKTLEDLVMNTYIPAYELNKARAVGFSCRIEPHTGKKSAGYTYPKDITRSPRPQEEGKGPQKSAHASELFERRLANLPVKVVAQASSSAPVFFSSTTFKQTGLGSLLDINEEEAKWVDGGVVSNNPTLQGLGFMSATFSKENDLLTWDRMAVLSLGTGGRRTPPVVCNRKSGLAFWGSDLVSVLMDTHTEVNHKIVDAMFDGRLFGRKTEYDRYVRINKIVRPGEPYYETLGALDSVEKLHDLMDFAENLLEEYKPDMREFVRDVLLASEE